MKTIEKLSNTGHLGTSDEIYIKVNELVEAFNQGKQPDETVEEVGVGDVFRMCIRFDKYDLLIVKSDTGESHLNKKDAQELSSKISRLVKSMD